MREGSGGRCYMSREGGYEGLDIAIVCKVVIFKWIRFVYSVYGKHLSGKLIVFSRTGTICTCLLVVNYVFEIEIFFCNFRRIFISFSISMTLQNHGLLMYRRFNACSFQVSPMPFYISSVYYNVVNIGIWDRMN